MKPKHQTRTTKASTSTKRSNEVARDYVKEYQEVVRLAQKDPVELSHEWNKEGDVFKECTLYNDDRAVLTTNTVLL